jgi:TonB family protein
VRQLCNSLLFVYGISVLWAPPLAAQSPAQRTAGDVALLVNTLDTPSVEAVQAAITASDPLVRTVAARIAGVTSHPPFGNALVAALANEQDPGTAEEQVRALLMIRGLLAASVVEARLGSLPAIGHAYAKWLASAQHERFAEVLPTLATSLGDERTGLSFYVSTALNTRPEGAESLVRTWLTVSTTQEWDGSLDAVYQQMRPGLETLLIEAVTTARPEIREVTIWNAVRRLAINQAVPSALLDAIAPAGAPPASTDGAALTWEQFGRELVVRRHRGTPTPDRSGFLVAEASKHRRDAISAALLPQVLETERKALRDILTSADQLPKETFKELTPKLDRSGMSMRTMPVEWPGFLQQLLDAAKCRVGKSPLFGVVYVTYRPNGTPAQLQVTKTPIPQGCEPALTALARLTFRDPDYQPRAGEGELLVLPFAREFVQCAADAGANRRGFRTAIGDTDGRGGRIVPPKKTRDVKPEYPAVDLQRRIQGAVVTQSTISPTGCISHLKIMRSVSPGIDFAALRAVTQWAFTPTLLNDQPVPVIMTVTVNFSLQ